MTNETRQKMLREFGWDNNANLGWDNEQPPSDEQIKSLKTEEVIIADDPCCEEEYQYEDTNCQECDDDAPGKDYPPGFIVIHQNVGLLPPFGAEAFCERVKDKFCNSKEWLDFKKKYPNWNFILQPTREFESYVEIYHQDDKHREDVKSIVVECLSEDTDVLQDTPELRKRAKEYTLLMLGAPVVNIELTDEQLNFCYEHSLNTLTDAFSRKKYFTLLDSARAQDENFLFEGVLAHATVILARIRMQVGLPQDGKVHMDANDLYEEGKEKLRKWKRWLNPDTFNEIEDAEEESEESA